jgi:hypothetical protein
MVLQQRVEESVRWHTKSSLIECYKGDHVSLCQRKGYKVLRHVVGRKLHRHHEPLPHEILQVLLHNLGEGLVLFSHDSRGMEKQCSLNPKSLSFVSLCLFRHKEEDEEAMTDCAR